MACTWVFKVSKALKPFLSFFRNLMLPFEKPLFLQERRAKRASSRITQMIYGSLASKKGYVFGDCEDTARS